MTLPEWLSDLRASQTEMKRRGHARYFFEMSWRTVWAETKLRLGLSVAFRRSVVQAADACEAEDTARGSGSSAVERYEKCRASGDHAGMAFWRSVSVYSVVSAMHGPEKIRIIDG
jgi:hypothetical protein